MGDVYRARDPRLDRDVAIKVLREAIADRPDAHARFLREARAVAALNHPHIVTIHEIGERENGEPFIAFELIQGETLDERLDDGPLSPDQVIPLALDVSDALAHAHQAGVVHRDLKPGNIMLRPDGRVKILDFGIGKFLADPAVQSAVSTRGRGSALTTGHELIGTVGYMAPEQVRGDPVDSRCDQFAFGTVLYEALTGLQPFARSSPFETLSAVLYTEPEPLRELRPDAPAALTDLIERCLQKDAGARFHDMRAVEQELQRAALEWQRTATAPTQVPGQAPDVEWWRQTRTRWGIVIALVVLLAGATAVGRIGRWFDAPTTVSAAGARVVVLPFSNLGHDPASQAYVDGTVEVLTATLTQLEPFQRQLIVVPVTEVRRERVLDARDARRRLGATLAVSGSMQWSGDTIRLTITVIDPATQRQLSARTIDGRGQDALALQDAAVVALSSMLEIQLQPRVQAGLSAGASARPGAYDLYVQGRGLLQRYDQRVATLDAALALFQQALRVDEQFPLAHAALGEALWRKYELTSDITLVESARRAALRAVQLNPAVAQVHMTLGMVQRGTGQYEEALKAFDQARILNAPRSDVYRELGLTYEVLRRYEDAEATYLKGVAERPADAGLHSRLGALYFSRRNYDKAAEQFERVIQLTPENARAYSNLGGTYLARKQFAAAEQQFRRSVELEPSDAVYSNLGTMYFDLHRYRESAEAFEQAVTIRDTDRRIWANLASAYEAVPDPTRARTALQRGSAVAERQLQIDPRSADVMVDLAYFQAAVGTATRARQLAGDAVRLAPRDARVLFRAATTYAVLNERSRAADLVLRALDAGISPSQVVESRPLAAVRELPIVRARLIQQ